MQWCDQDTVPPGQKNARRDLEHDPTPWLSYRAFADLVLWVAVLTVFLLYLWALSTGSVSAVDPAPERAPAPLQKPVSPSGTSPALV